MFCCAKHSCFLSRASDLHPLPLGHRDRSRPTAHTLESHDPPGPARAPRRSSPSPRVKCMGCTSCTTSPPPERAVVSPCSTSNRQRRVHAEAAHRDLRTQRPRVAVPALPFFPWIAVRRRETHTWWQHAGIARCSARCQTAWRVRVLMTPARYEMARRVRVLTPARCKTARHVMMPRRGRTAGTARCQTAVRGLMMMMIRRLRWRGMMPRGNVQISIRFTYETNEIT